MKKFNYKIGWLFGTLNSYKPANNNNSNGSGRQYRVHDVTGLISMHGRSRKNILRGGFGLFV